MQKILIPIRIIFISFLIAFLSSCTSSSYTERYKSTENNDAKIIKNEKNHTLHEEEISVDDLPAINTSAKKVIKKFTPYIGNNKKKKKFLYELANYIKVPYKYGGETKSGIDCSAFTQQVYRNSLNVKIPRTAREQYRIGDRIKKIKNLKFGDLVFFNTSQIYYPGHVGIYLGDKLFIHASASKGVMISSLENSYFLNRFIGATRVKIKRIHN